VDKEGCEFDTDGDGVINSQDYCPQNTKIELSKGIAVNGCPKQSDFDGTPDYRDKCPDTPRGVKSDKDGCQIKNKH
jgi:OOP family OmpA-OmpF porin